MAPALFAPVPPVGQLRSAGMIGKKFGYGLFDQGLHGYSLQSGAGLELAIGGCGDSCADLLPLFGFPSRD